MKTVLIAALATAALAQHEGPGGPGFVRLMSAGLDRPGHVVTNAPFSGKEVTTAARTLADGTHITRTNTAQLYRDASGRMRIERTLTGIGPWSSGAAPKTFITIFDPVAGFVYELNPANSTATKRALPTPPPNAGERQRSQADNVTTKNLGTQTVDGFECTGTLTTRTIPAGQIGNDQAITVTTEKWVSTALQVTLQSKHVDPMTGETDMAFQNLTAGPPDPSLFTVPSNYTVTTSTRSMRSGQFRQPAAPVE